MRTDMHYLLVDRGSKGGLKPKGRIEQKVKDDPEYQGTKYLPISRSRQYGSSQKWQDDYLAPLRRFLEKQLGRPWDEVYSEIRAVVKPNSTVNYHVYQHLEWEVAKHVQYIEGQPYSKQCSWGGWQPVRGLYVCPDSGILKRTPRQNNKLKPQLITKVTLDTDRWYELIDGQWYLMSIHRWREKLVKRIVESKYGFSVPEMEEKEFYKVDKKQLGKKQIMALQSKLRQMSQVE